MYNCVTITKLIPCECTHKYNIHRLPINNFDWNMTVNVQWTHSDY